MTEKLLGHIFALVSIIIWGLTFISTKILLNVFDPVEIMIFRFFMAYILLCIIYPKQFRIMSMKEEFKFFILGLSGVSFYFLAENIALTYTLASNTSFILTTAPLYTAIIAHIFSDDEKFNKSVIIGFVFSIIGVFLVVYNSKVTLQINPIGDLLALLAAIMWGIYSVSLKKLPSTYNSIFIVRKTFFYGIITIIPFIAVFNADMRATHIDTSIIINLLFLGLIASALCYVLWNKAVSLIGAVKSTNYIYLIPLVTVVSSALILDEKINLIMIIGGVFILGGVIMADKWK
ncbi:MAG: DMT family transporter [Vallitalea sp.]|jgi:drug/metabolite transporter (DMT)-like permease|nr:DMT family transporter [Vallitalea sp.]